MPTDTLSRPLDAEQLNRLHDLALERALQLRAQAIDECWRRVIAGLRAGLRAGLARPRRPTRLPREAPAG